MIFKCMEAVGSWSNCLDSQFNQPQLNTKITVVQSRKWNLGTRKLINKSYYVIQTIFKKFQRFLLIA